MTRIDEDRGRGVGHGHGTNEVRMGRRAGRAAAEGGEEEIVD